VGVSLDDYGFSDAQLPFSFSGGLNLFASKRVKVKACENG